MTDSLSKLCVTVKKKEREGKECRREKQREKEREIVVSLVVSEVKVEASGGRRGGELRRGLALLRRLPTSLM